MTHAGLLTSARLRTKILDAFLGVLEAAEVLHFGTMIPLHESIPDTWGEVPSNFRGYELVTAEIFEAVGRQAKPKNIQSADVSVDCLIAK